MFKKENLPNLLTLARIVLIPIFLLMTSLASSNVMHIAAAVVFAIASITDYLDGYLARKWHVVTNFGKFADPLADKMLVMSAFIMLVGINQAPAWVVSVIICRELAVTGLRLLLVENGDSDVIYYSIIVSSAFCRNNYALYCFVLYNLLRL